MDIKYITFHGLPVFTNKEERYSLGTNFIKMQEYDKVVAVKKSLWNKLFYSRWNTFISDCLDDAFILNLSPLILKTVFDEKVELVSKEKLVFKSNPFPANYLLGVEQLKNLVYQDEFIEKYRYCPKPVKSFKFGNNAINFCHNFVQKDDFINLLTPEEINKILNNTSKYQVAADEFIKNYGDEALGCIISAQF